MVSMLVSGNAHLLEVERCINLDLEFFATIAQFIGRTKSAFVVGVALVGVDAGG